MIELSFEINGRKVRLERIASEMEKAVLKSIKEDITRKLQDIRDPETGEQPRVTVRGRSLDKLKIELSGSKRIIKKAQKIFK